MTKQTKTQMIAAQVAQILATETIQVADVTQARNEKGHFLPKYQVKLVGRGLNTPFKRHYYRKTRFPKIAEAGFQTSFIEKTRGAGDVMIVELQTA